jgi:hypothetical protein
MKSLKVFLTIFFLAFIFILVNMFYPLFSISIASYAQTQMFLPINNDKFLDYFNPSIFMKIKYPSFWQKPIPIANDTVSFSSPVTGVGVMIQNKPLKNMSIDEISMNIISNIKKDLPNVKIHNMNITNSTDGSINEKFEFSYGYTADAFKDFQNVKIIDGRVYIFSYYADSALFDQFYPIASFMLKSLKIPIFTNAFPQIPISNTIKHTNQNNETMKKATDNAKIPANVSIADNKNNQTLESKNVSTYDNKVLGIKIDYPNFLNKVEKDRGVSFITTNKSIGILLVNTPLSNISESDFISAHINSLNSSFTNFNILNSLTSDLLGYPTPMILFSYNNGNQLFKAMQFWKVVGDHVYIFTYYAQSNRLFDELLPIVQNMTKSLKISY